MRKFRPILFAVFLLLNGFVLFAQDKNVTGVIRDSKDNTPLAGATVTNQRSKAAVQTNAYGVYTISARAGDVLNISFVGFGLKQVTVGNNASVDVRLESSGKELEEVVVALDLKRKPRELGYSQQQVKGSEIQETQRENFINSLQGRVAGLTITPTGGTAGASSSIVLRGFNSLSLSNEPLFVVDGVIMDNNTVNETSSGGQGVGLASDRPNRNNDYSNRMSDLNPNDIQSITVLKGPEATALYGSQASSGAIVIITKKAKSNKLAVQYDNAFRFQKVTRFPETINTYQNGTAGNPSNIFRYFGPKYDASDTLYDNKDYFFRTGFSQSHNLGADFGFKNSVFRFSGSFFDQAGVVPNNDYQRVNLRLSNTTKFGKKVEVIPSLAYIRTTNDKVLRSAGGYLLSLFAWPDNNDIRRYQDDAGNKLPLFSSNPNADYDNPLFNVNNNKSRDVTDRVTATLGININPWDWLSLAGRFGYDTYSTDGYTIYHPKSFFITAALNGEQDNFYRRYSGYNHTITATAKKQLGDFNGRLMIGQMWQDYETRMFAVKGNNLTDPKRSDSGNSAPNTRIRLLRNNFGEFNRQIIRQAAYFGEAALSYKNFVFLNYSLRFESASTLPAINRDYNYMGASLSVIVSDIFPELQKGNVLNYFKLRTSLAGTARLNSPYSTQSVFVDNFASGGGSSYGFFNNSPTLAPEQQDTYEVGAEFKMFKNKIGFDVTYYNTQTKGQIVENFRLSYATGFVLNTQNAASTRNQGIEISIDASVINNKDFGWNIRFNANRMWNKVVGLPLNVSEYYIADTWLYANARGGLVLGGPTTSITSAGYVRNNAGAILINPTSGLPVTETIFKVRGDRNPDFTLGTINTFRYKNWNFSFLWDLKVGGDVFNANEMFLTTIGKSKRTANRYTARVVTGVLQDGKQNSANPTWNTISVVPAFVANDAYYQATNMPEEAFIEKDVNWLRLRDVTLSYTFPRTGFLKNANYIKSLGFFVTGNDLLLFTNYNGADPAVNGNTAGSRGVGAYGFDYGTLATPISVNIGIRAGF